MNHKTNPICRIVTTTLSTVGADVIAVKDDGGTNLLANLPFLPTAPNAYMGKLCGLVVKDAPRVL
jgi:hypothetical protein